MARAVAQLIVPISAPLILAAACSTAPSPSSPPRVAATHEAKRAEPSPAAEDAPPAEPAPTASPAPAATAQAASAAVDEKGCVVDPLAHAARIIVEQHGREIAEQFGRPPSLADFAKSKADLQALPDLDGDGAAETEVTEGCCWGVHASLHLLYLSNRGCLRFAGALVDGELTALATARAGVRDLEARWSNGCAGWDFAWTRYRWNGKAYGVADKATCWFCPDRTISVPPPGANRHPYCQEHAREMAKDARPAKERP